MERMTLQEWNVLDEDQKKAREAEMPWDIFAQKSKGEQERLISLNVEKDRKLKAANAQIKQLDDRIKALEASGGSQSQINNLEDIKAQFQSDYEKDPTMAIAKLANQGIQYTLQQNRQYDFVKKQTLRKIRKDYAKDYAKHSDELEDKLDLIVGPITADEIMSMFNSLRGKSIDSQIEEARKEGAQKALADAGIVAIDEGGASSQDHPKTSLTQEQQKEATDMGLDEKEYKDVLRGRQEADRLAGRTPRILVSPKK